MPRGSRPGERRGGRAKNVPNKVTAARAAAIKEVAQATGRKLAKDVMAEAMTHFLALANKYALDTQEADEKKFDKYLKLSADIARDLAPYESQRMSVTTIRGDEGAPLRAKIEVEFV